MHEFHIILAGLTSKHSVFLQEISPHPSVLGVSVSDARSSVSGYAVAAATAD